MKHKYLNFKSIWLCLFAVISFQYAYAQSITGKISDAVNGEGLPGVNVLIKGTTNGTVTDLDGNYTLNASSNDILVISSVGYITQEISVGSQSTINVSLSEDIQSLAEVVVVGYGEIEAGDATGAVTSVKPEDFNKGVIASPEELIQGRAAGVQITTASGEPGSGINIRVRGTSSVRSNNNPLFVVDGVPLSGGNTQAGGDLVGFGSSTARNPLNFLNPSDIASIDILKDASATAIYGSRGANGVIIITTKSGKAGQGTLDYSVSFGVSKISETYDLLERDAFLDAYEGFNGAQAAADLDGGANTDWQDEVFRTALTQSHNLSYGGGSESGDYRFSLAYFDQEGIVTGSGLERVTARFNGKRRFINDRLTVSAQFTVSNTKDDLVPISDNSGFRGDLIGNVLKANPTTPVRDTNGDFVQPGITEPNPVAIIELSEIFANTLRALGNISAELKITDDLSFKTVLGIDKSISSRTDAFSRDLVAGDIVDIGRLTLSDIDISNNLWENYFTYKKGFGNVNLTGLLGYSYQEFTFTQKIFEMANFRTGDLDLMINNFASADQDDNTNSAVGRNSAKTVDELQSFFGRVNVDIQDRYLFTATLRADGSTRFGSGNQYGYFPSFAFKWRLSDEAFVPELFSDLGLRVGYGLTGNQEIPHNLFQERQRYGDWTINSGASGTDGGGLSSVAFANPDLKWESTSQINLGIDFGFAGNRLSGSLDFYRKNTNDLLIQVTAAQPAVAPFVWDNLDADVINQGIELSLTGVVMDSDLYWEILGNFAYNKNEVQDFGGLIDTGDIDGQGLTGAFSQRIAEGQPLFAYFLRQFGGFDDAGNSIYPNGDFQEFTGDSPLPTVTAGVTNTLRYKGFDLTVFFTGQFGHSIYSNTANAFFTAGSLANGRNVTTDVVGNGEGSLNAPDVSTRFLEKGDFVRLQNVSIGYNVPTTNSVISSLRLYLTGQNLFVITDYSGQDPEVNVNKQINGVPSFGIDYTTYPRARTFTFGANITF